MNVVHHARKRRTRRIALLRASLRIASVVAPPVAARIAEDLFSTPPRYVRHQRELGVVATGIRTDVTYGHQRIAVTMCGNGPNVYLLHGWGGVASQLSNFVEPLVTAGFRVVMIDGPAHGDSSGRRSSVVEFATALREVVDRVGSAHAIIGHSMGCASIAVAIHRGLRTDRALFIAPPASPEHYLDQFVKILGLGREVRERMRRRIQERIGFDWDELNVPSMATSFSTPLLIIHDEEDREALLREAQEIHAAWQGSRLIVTHGLGHHRILRDPRVVEQAVGFISASA